MRSTVLQLSEVFAATVRLGEVPVAKIPGMYVVVLDVAKTRQYTVKVRVCFESSA